MYKLPCGCGKSLKVDDRHLGKRVRCPACETVLDVPTSFNHAAWESQSVPSFSDPRPAASEAAPAFSSAPESEDFDLFSTGSLEDTYSQPAGFPSVTDRPSNSYVAPLPAGRPRPVARKNNRKKESAVEWGQVSMGLLMVVGAVVWFVAGLFGGVIFFYPPILLVLGMITIGKGLMS